MTPTIVPTITAETTEAYQVQLEAVRPFAKRIHIDLMDGQFAPTKSLGPDQLWWPANIRADLHVMFKQPFMFNELFVALSPALVIVHAESEGSFVEFAKLMHSHGIETGLALLPETAVDTILPALPMIDHVLVFSGNLGHQGGSRADPNLLQKVAQLRKVKPTLEIGWDGGINDKNAAALAKSGVHVLNVGGFIQKSDSPADSYRALERKILY